MKFANFLLLCGLLALLVSCKPKEDDFYAEPIIDMSLAGKSGDSSFVWLSINQKNTEPFNRFTTFKKPSNTLSFYYQTGLRASCILADTIYQLDISFISSPEDSTLVSSYALQKHVGYSLRYMEGNREIKSRGVEISFSALSPDADTVYYRHVSSDTTQIETISYFSLDGFTPDVKSPHTTYIKGRFQCDTKKGKVLEGIFQGAFEF